MLGAGWYKGVMGLTKARNNYGDQTAFAMELHVLYEDGEKEVICTDESWLGADSPVIFAEIYDGEIYDAHLEIPCWSVADIPGGEWHPVESVGPRSRYMREFWQNGFLLRREERQSSILARIWRAAFLSQHQAKRATASSSTALKFWTGTETCTRTT